MSNQGPYTRPGYGGGNEAYTPGAGGATYSAPGSGGYGGYNAGGSTGYGGGGSYAAPTPQGGYGMPSGGMYGQEQVRFQISK